MDSCNAAGMAPLPTATLASATQEKDPDQRFRDTLERMLNYVADKLFRAEDNDALEDKLDELLDDTEFMVHVQAVAGATPVTSLLLVAEELLPPPSLLALFRSSRSLMDLAKEAWLMAHGMFAIYFEISRRALDGTAKKIPTSPVMSHMLSHALPTYFKRCVFYSRRADAASWGILAAARLQDDDVLQLEDGLAEHLLHIWHDSARKYLQLAVSMGFELPEQFRSLVPPGPPISPQEEWHAARARADHMLQQLSEAKEIDAAVHPPVEDDDD